MGSCPGGAQVSEEQQANYLVRSMVIAQQGGAQHISWFQLEDSFNNSDQTWANAAILRNYNVSMGTYPLKLAYTAYQVLFNQLNGGAQQNLRMPYNSAAARHELALPGAVAGTRVDYWFTYNNGQPAYDSARFTATVTAGGTDPGTPQNPGTPGNGADWNTLTTFKVENPAGWPAGDYQLRIAINGHTVRTEAFTVQ